MILAKINGTEVFVEDTIYKYLTELNETIQFHSGSDFNFKLTKAQLARLIDIVLQDADRDEDFSDSLVLVLTELCEQNVNDVDFILS